MTQRAPRQEYRQPDRPPRSYDGRPPRERRRPPRQSNQSYEETSWYEEDARQWEEEPYRQPQRPPRNPRPRPENPYGREQDYRREAPYSQNARGPRPVYTNRSQVHTPPPPSESSGKKIFAFVYNLIFYVVTIGILVMSVLFAFTSKEDASIFGYRFYTVLTDSMVPQEDSQPGGFYSGDIIIIKLINGSEVEKGDIVTFMVGEGDRFLTHRVVETMDELNGEEGEYLVTKGDANQTNDPPIKADRVVGKKVFTIPKAGGVLDFIRENLWLCLVCIISTFGFILVLKAYFFSEPKAEEPPQWQAAPAPQRW